MNAIACWNCRQPLTGPGACNACGARQDMMAPPQMGRPGQGMPGPVMATPQQRRRVPGDLGTKFAGPAAGVGRRLGAFALDALTVTIVVAAALLLSGSAVLAGTILVETVVALSIWEARTGLTVGNAAMRIRTSSAERPWSPGIGRQTARSAVMWLGGLVAIVGAWIVVISAAWDGTGKRRSWADRAGGTVVVVVPPRRRTTAEGMPLVAPQSGAVAPGQAPVQFMAPRAVSTLPAGSVVPDAQIAAVLPVPVPQAAYNIPAPGTMAPAGAASDSAARSTLLLVFDTGQRAQLHMGAAAVLGRGPSSVEPADNLISVRDDEGTVSKNHLRIEHTREGVWLTDLGSTNGTDLLEDDGEEIGLPVAQRTFLDDGVRVRIGHRVFTISHIVSGV